VKFSELQFFLRASIFLTFLCHFEIQSSDTLLLPLDGLTQFPYNPKSNTHEYSSINEGFYLAIPGIDPYSLSSSMSLNKDTAQFKFFGQLGSETGDILLNKISSDTSYNRDHQTLIMGGISLPEAGLELYGRYRYADIYSDNLDKIAAQYPMKKSEKGLADDIGGLAVYRVGESTLEAEFYRFGYWAITSGLYAPLYVQGNSFCFSSRHRSSLFTLGSRFQYVKRDMFYNQRDSTENDYLKCNLSFDSVRIKKTVAKGEIHFDERKKAPLLTSLTVSDDGNGGAPFTWSAYGAVNSDRDASIHVQGQRNFGDRFIPKVSYRQGVTSTSCDYSYIGFGDTVQVEQSEHTYQTFDLSGKFLIKNWGFIEFFHHINFLPYLDRLDQSINGSYLYTLKYFKSRQYQKTGMSFNFKKDISRFRFSLSGSYHHDAGSIDEPFCVPWYGALLCETGDLGTVDAFYAMMRLTFYGESIMTRLINDQKVSETVKSRAALLAKVRIPFFAPVARHLFRTALWIEAGPLHLRKEQRLKYHPLGNPIGPVIHVRGEVSRL